MKKNKKLNNSKLWDFHQNENRKYLNENISRQLILFKEIKGLFKSSSKIIIAEIGFGNGDLLTLLKTKFEKIYGLDISKKNIEITKKQLKGISFKLIDDSGKLPFRDSELDCLVASEVIEHMDDKELILFKKELYRVLKKGGFFIGSVPAKENLKENSIYCPNCNLYFHKWGHKQSFTEKKLLKEFNGFRNIKLKYYFNRYKGKNIFENLIGLLLYFVRLFLSKFMFVKSSGYLFIFKNEKK